MFLMSFLGRSDGSVLAAGRPEIKYFCCEGALFLGREPRGWLAAAREAVMGCLFDPHPPPPGWGWGGMVLATSRKPKGHFLLRSILRTVDSGIR